MYDELNLDEEEEKFGLVADERDSDESEDESEGLLFFLLKLLFRLSMYFRSATSDTVKETRRRKHIE